MKFKNIKAFEDFDSHSREDDDQFKMFSHEDDDADADYDADCNDDDDDEDDDDADNYDERAWGDEGTKLERFSTFNEKKKEKKDDKKPDFKDFDKDGDKKEPMTKALKDKEAKEKDSKKFEKPKKGEIPAGLKKFMDKKKK